jgi:hypothetical protein
LRPIYHAAAAGVSCIPLYLATHSPELAAGFAVTEIAVDTDHIIDYLMWGDRPLTLKSFFKKGIASTWTHLVFFLHSYEWMLLVVLFAWRARTPLTLGIAMGYVFHMAADEIGNRLPSVHKCIRKPFYFFTYRLLQGFRSDRISYPNKRRIG